MSPEDFTFCPSCAEPLGGAAATREVRRTVSVVFCDVVGSTAIGERLDPEELREVMSRYFAVARDALERHGETVEKFIGDAVVGVFGVPLAHEDDALRAVRAADQMSRAVEELDREIGIHHGIGLVTRIGVNTGEVVAGDDMGGALVVGDCLNLAARLEQAAAPGEVLLGAHTHRLVRDAVRVEQLPPLHVKGKAGPVSAFRLLAVTARGPARVRIVGSPMVGRSQERAQLDEAFAQARRERACVLVTIVGTAGVGKSRLVEEFLGGLDGAPLVLRGRCLDYGEGITYWPVLEALGGAASIEESDSVGLARSKLASLLEGAADAPVIVERVANVMGLGGAAAPDETWWAIRRLLETLAARQPLVVVFDDVHWGVPTFLDLVQHVRQRSREAPILLLCVARPELLDDRPGWGRDDPAATILVLEPLPEAESRTLLGHLLASEPFDGSVRDLVLGAAGGNPLFVEEMLAMLLDEGHLEQVDGTWQVTDEPTAPAVPPTIAALLGARLDRLLLHEREVLERGSVEGGVFHRGAVVALAAGAPTDSLGADLMDLVRRDLIRSEPAELSGDDAYRFRHLLIRDATYQAMPKRVRADLHELLADWLVSTWPDRVEEYQEIVGHHYELAHGYRVELGMTDERATGLAARAAGHLAAAAQRARERGDLPATQNLGERAVALVPAGDPVRTSLLLLVGDTRFDRGELTSAAAAYTQALAAAAAVGDERSEWLARMASQLVLSLTTTEPLVAEAQLVAREAIGVFERLDDAEGLARAWWHVADWAEQVGRMDDAVEAFERGLVSAARSGRLAR